MGRLPFYAGKFECFLYCARRDIVLLNAAAALVAAGQANDFREGIKQAAESIDSGHALKKLERLKEITNRKR